jgi:hypothetical protein
MRELLFLSYYYDFANVVSIASIKYTFHSKITAGIDIWAQLAEFVP